MTYASVHLVLLYIFRFYQFAEQKRVIEQMNLNFAITFIHPSFVNQLSTFVRQPEILTPKINQKRKNVTFKKRRTTSSPGLKDNC